MPSGRDPRRPVHIAADVALIRQERRSGVHPNANPDRARSERISKRIRSRERSRRRRKSEEESVSLSVDLDAALNRTGPTDQTSVLGKRR
jgi:hypothetical protein